VTFFQILDSLLLQPLQLLFEVVYVNANRVIGNPGLSIIVLSLVMNFLVLPLYMRADALQEEERDMEARLHRGVTHIKKTFRGDEKMMILQTYYRQNHYKPTYVLRSAVSLFLEIPFFIAAYRFLSGLELIKGVSFGPIADLGAADGLIAIAGVHINLLPIIMTAVNLVSCIIFTKGATPKTKIQLYVMAVFFLFFLYTPPVWCFTGRSTTSSPSSRPSSTSSSIRGGCSRSWPPSPVRRCWRSVSCAIPSPSGRSSKPRCCFWARR